MTIVLHQVVQVVVGEVAGLGQVQLCALLGQGSVVKGRQMLVYQWKCNPCSWSVGRSVCYDMS